MTKKYQLKSMKLADDEKGTIEAVFATMNVEDSDGDVTINGAFGEQKVIISQYNHGSWNTGVEALPIGVGKIYERGDEAILEGEFDMEDDAAVKTYRKIKYLVGKGRVQEWSYALPEIDYEFREEDGHTVRVLKKITVNEVSPVLMGAGVDTRVLSVKGKGEGEAMNLGKMKLREHFDYVEAEILDLHNRLVDLKHIKESEGKALSPALVERIRLLADSLRKMRDSFSLIAQDERVSLELQNEMLRHEILMTRSRV